MREFEIYLPLRYNDGTPVAAAVTDRLGDRLLAAFGGYTFFAQPHQGAWRMGDVTFHDEIVIFRVITGRVRFANRYFKQLKEELKAELEQEEILITSKDIDTL